MSNRNLMAGESIDPFTGRLRTVYDELGRPVCVRCHSRIFAEETYCDSCLELVQIEQAQENAASTATGADDE